MNEKIIHAKELMKFLGVSRTTLWRLEKNGDIPPSRKFARGRIKGWTEHDLNAILNNRHEGGGQ